MTLMICKVLVYTCVSKEMDQCKFHLQRLVNAWIEGNHSRQQNTGSTLLVLSVTVCSAGVCLQGF